ncbi:MAG: cytochrome P450, partial [Candidatus Obscuribacterales bacterium]|nr:cytochrome P450 [Candidatus Obscuribacterales bacterium]
MTQKLLLPAKQIPGPSPMPLIGSRGNLISFMRDPIGYMLMLLREHGDIAAMVKEVPKGMIFAFGPKYNQQFLSDADTYLNVGVTQKGPQDSANYRVGVGLLSMNGDAHKRMRRLLSPPFHYKTIPGYHEPVSRLAEEMIESWEDGKVVDMWAELNRLTKLISIKMLLGLDDPKTALSVADQIAEWFDVNISFQARAFQIDLPGFPYRKMLKLADELEARLLRLIKQKRDVLNDTDDDVLSLLLRASFDESEPITDAELVG